MKNSSMYAYLLSKKIPLYSIFIGIMYYLLFFYTENTNFNYMLGFVVVWIELMVFIELHFSFVRTFDLMRYVADKQVKKKVRFYLQILPYAPAIFGTLVICLFKFFKEGILYPWEVALILTVTQLSNFIATVVFNTRIGLSEFINKPEIPTKKKKQPRIKTDSEVSEK